jgi:uncharacterized protein with von Willebrand factor type A (vWA) domain
MNFDSLPLFTIFNSLRQRHSLPLGIEEYLVALKSLQAGFGIANRQELEELCCTLWAKSPEECHLVRQLVAQMWNSLEESSSPDNPSRSASPENQEVSRPNTTPSLETPSPKNQEVSRPNTTPSPETASPSPPSLSSDRSLETDDPVQVVKALRGGNQNRRSLSPSPRYRLLKNYFPVTKRQMKQHWRNLRRPVREGIPTELDLEATVTKIGSEGILLEPVLVPRRINRTDLVLLIDRKGSMVPFHTLSRQLVETAERGGRLKQTRVFYFHNYAQEYLYRHPALLNAVAIEEVLAEMGKRSVILIVSDGGAARKSYKPDRVEKTQAWVDDLQQSMANVAWLNPMPEESWQQTTAEKIAEMLPTFEMSREGMGGAIAALRGQKL